MNHRYPAIETRTHPRGVTDNDLECTDRSQLKMDLEPTSALRERPGRPLPGTLYPIVAYDTAISGPITITRSLI